MTTDTQTARSRFALVAAELVGGSLAEDVRRGLTAARKAIPPHHFYDPLGSALFEAICNLPEYYVTRAEKEVLTIYGPEIAAALGAPARVVELGAGNARKTRMILDHLAHGESPIEYVPLDVDASMLERSGRELLAQYPSLKVTAVVGDFRRPSRAIRAVGATSGRTAVLFLGSSIGNLDPDSAARMVRDLRAASSPGDRFLLGVDMKKSKDVLEPAYDDALGVTASFNKNLLQRINRELGGHFDLSAFAHQAFYDEARGRIEMHLVSLREQVVHIDALELEIAFAESETIHTESSYKYDRAALEALAEPLGFSIERTWTDSKGWFADVLLVAH
jgi:dimethylhistidine N-methyltransferase